MQEIFTHLGRNTSTRGKGEIDIYLRKLMRFGTEHTKCEYNGIVQDMRMLQGNCQGGTAFEPAQKDVRMWKPKC
jgi:hypothetical protein